MKAFVVMMTVVLCLPLYGVPGRQWPLIQATVMNERMNLPNIDNPNRLENVRGQRVVDVVVKSAQGVPVYKIECGTPDRSNAEIFEYSGDFQCRMIPWGSEVSRIDLFSEMPNRSHDWQSRARFFASEVLGSCGAIPEFGRIRSFRLRGMKITLAMSDIDADMSGKVPTLNAFNFKVTVVPDPAATSSIVEVPELDPKWRNVNCSLDDSVSAHFRK
jgi:hypothetical protein